VCLPLLIFLCTIKSRSSLLAPAHPGGPIKRAVKRLCVFVSVHQYIPVLCRWQVLWEVYSYELAGAAGLPAAAADLLMLSLLRDAHRSLPVSDKWRPGTTTAVYRFDGSAGSYLRVSRVSYHLFSLVTAIFAQGTTFSALILLVVHYEGRLGII